MAQAQAPIASPSGAGSIGERIFLAVETAASWGGDWTRRPYIEPVRGAKAIAPSLGTATFKFNFGMIKAEDQAAFAQRDPLEILGQYLRVIRLSGSSSAPIWHGCLDVESFIPHAGAQAAGLQEFQAFEIGHDLDRDDVSDAVAENTFGAETTIGWCPVINERYEKGVREFGNRSAAVGSDGAHFFSPDASVWTHLDVAEMVLKRYTPANGPTFELGGQKDALAQLKSVVRLEGRTPWSILNELIDRRRGLGFVPEVAGAKVVLRVFSILEEALKLGEVEIPANAAAYNLDLASSIKLDRPIVTRHVSTRFDEIEVRGERSVTCFTCGHDDDVLEYGMTDDEEEDYADAASGVTGYSGLSDAEKAQLNDDYRKTDKFEAVYAKHRIAPGWNGEVGDSKKVFPVFDDQGEYELQGGAYFFPMGKSFEDWLPFYERVVNPANPLDTSALPSGAEPTHRRPFAIAYDEDEDKSFYVDKPLEVLGISGAQFNLYPRELAFAVEANPRHLFGLGHFDPDEAEPSNTDPAVKPGGITATLALVTDQVVRMVGRRSGLEDGARIRRKVIRVPEAHFWYCVPGTVIDLDAEAQPILYSGTGILRDDRSRLREVLAFALAWYGQERRAVEVVVRDTVEDLVPLGALLKTAVTGNSRIAIGTVVSSLEFDWKQFSTEVKTMWAETDWEKD